MERTVTFCENDRKKKKRRKPKKKKGDQVMSLITKLDILLFLFFISSLLYLKFTTRGLNDDDHQMVQTNAGEMHTQGSGRIEGWVSQESESLFSGLQGKTENMTGLTISDSQSRIQEKERERVRQTTADTQENVNWKMSDMKRTRVERFRRSDKIMKGRKELVRMYNNNNNDDHYDFMRALGERIRKSWSRSEIEFYTTVLSGNRTGQFLETRDKSKRRYKRYDMVMAQDCINKTVTRADIMKTCYMNLTLGAHACLPSQKELRETFIKGCSDILLHRVEHMYVQTMEQGSSFDYYAASLGFPRMWAYHGGTIYRIDCDTIQVQLVRDSKCYSDQARPVRHGKRLLYLARNGYISKTSISIPCVTDNTTEQIYGNIQTRKNNMMSAEILSLFLFNQINSKLLMSKIFGLENVKKLILLESAELIGMPVGSWVTLIHLYYRSYSGFFIIAYTIFRTAWCITIFAMGCKRKLPFIKNLSFCFSFLKNQIDLNKWSQEHSLAQETNAQCLKGTEAKKAVINLSVQHLKRLYMATLRNETRINRLEECFGLQASDTSIETDDLSQFDELGTRLRSVEVSPAKTETQF